MSAPKSPLVGDGDRLDILKTRYSEQAANLRDLNQYDLKVVGGFITIQLALAAWFANNPLNDWVPKLAILALDFALLFVCIFVIDGSRQRRFTIGQTIRNINAALELTTPGFYLPNKPLNPPEDDPDSSRARWRGTVVFGSACSVSFIAFVFMVFALSKSAAP